MSLIGQPYSVHTVKLVPTSRLHTSIFISPAFIFMYTVMCLLLLILFICLCVRFCRVESEKENFDGFEDEEILIKVNSPND